MSESNIDLPGAVANDMTQNSDPEVTVRGRCFPRGTWSFDSDVPQNVENVAQPTYDMPLDENTDNVVPLRVGTPQVQDYALPPPLRSVQNYPPRSSDIAPPRYSPYLSDRARVISILMIEEIELGRFHVDIGPLPL